MIIDYLALLIDEENSQPIAQSDVSEARWVGLEDLNDYDPGRRISGNYLPNL